MINIPKSIWYVVKAEHADGLAYMCSYQENKDGTPAANVVKMQNTGRSWAKKHKREYKLKEGASGQYDYERNEHGQAIISRDEFLEGIEFTTDNTPMTGFYVGCSVSRWSTSNKLFRVKDPRGFTVEIPTDNLATLLHHTTVVNGYVQDECVWGREGSNHILLPVNSEPYLLTLGQMDTLENKLIPMKDLKVGDWVKMFEDDMEYYYAGKIKGKWNIRGVSGDSFWGSYSKGQSAVNYSEWEEIVDDKWSDVFLYKSSYEKENKYVVTTFSKPKVVKVIKNSILNIEVKDYVWWCPTRVTNKAKNSQKYARTEKELVGIFHKK